jgi:hypothetical protein
MSKRCAMLQTPDGAGSCSTGGQAVNPPTAGDRRATPRQRLIHRNTLRTAQPTVGSHGVRPGVQRLEGPGRSQPVGPPHGDRGPERGRGAPGPSLRTRRAHGGTPAAHRRLHPDLHRLLPRTQRRSALRRPLRPRDPFRLLWCLEASPWARIWPPGVPSAATQLSADLLAVPRTQWKKRPLCSFLGAAARRGAGT